MSRQLRYLSREIGDSLPTCMATSKENDHFSKHFAYMIITGSTSPTTTDDEVWSDAAPRDPTVGSFLGNDENPPNGNPQQNTPRYVADHDITLEKIRVWMSGRLTPFNQYAAPITEERYIEVLQEMKDQMPT